MDAELGVVLPAAALVYGALIGNVAQALSARGADPGDASKALNIASWAVGLLIVGAAATRSPQAAVGSAVVVGAVGFYWHRFVL